MKLHSGCNQRIPEYHSWVCLVGGMKAKSYVELGCGSAEYMLNAGIEKIVTVDLLPNGLGNSICRHLQASSQDPETLAKVLEILGEQPDVVFIDADHEAESVRKDFALWHPVAKLAVGFHDILMPSVLLAWNEISLRYPSVQIIGKDVASAEKWQYGINHPTGHVDCGGIGVVFKESE